MNFQTLIRNSKKKQSFSLNTQLSCWRSILLVSNDKHHNGLRQFVFGVSQPNESTISEICCAFQLFSNQPTIRSDLFVGLVDAGAKLKIPNSHHHWDLTAAAAADAATINNNISLPNRFAVARSLFRLSRSQMRDLH